MWGRYFDVRGKDYWTHMFSPRVEKSPFRIPRTPNWQFFPRRAKIAPLLEML
jgi:hypothetical protein